MIIAKNEERGFMSAMKPFYKEVYLLFLNPKILRAASNTPMIVKSLSLLKKLNTNANTPNAEKKRNIKLRLLLLSDGLYNV